MKQQQQRQRHPKHHHSLRTEASGSIDKRRLSFFDRYQLKISKRKSTLHALLDRKKKLLKLIQEQLYPCNKVTPPAPFSCIKYVLSSKQNNSNTRSGHTNGKDQQHDYSKEDLLKERTNQYNDLFNSALGKQLTKEVVNFINLMGVYNLPPSNFEVQEYAKLVAERLGVDPSYDFDDGVWLDCFCERYTLQLKSTQQQNDEELDYNGQQSDVQLRNDGKYQHENGNSSSSGEEDREIIGNDDDSDDGTVTPQQEVKEEEGLSKQINVVTSIKNVLDCDSPSTEEEARFVSRAVRILSNRSFKLAQQEVDHLEN